MFRGARVLADGRQDPFITNASLGVYDMNAFERSDRIVTQNLIAVAEFDKPDYIIFPLTRSIYQDMLKEKADDYFGEPVFQGKSGYVYKFNKKED
jgi:hypothetical protein